MYKYYSFIKRYSMSKKCLTKGQKFGRLTIIRHYSREKGYECRCDCGNITIAKTWALKTGRHKSCGCLMREKVAARMRLPDNLTQKNNLYRQYKNSAKRRGYEFTLSKEEFIDMVEQECSYCGTSPCTTEKSYTCKYNHIDYYYNGVDRIDNSIGYTKSNCVTACKFCNNSKNTLSKDKFLEYIKKIYIYNFE